MACGAMPVTLALVLVSVRIFVALVLAVAVAFVAVFVFAVALCAAVFALAMVALDVVAFVDAPCVLLARLVAGGAVAVARAQVQAQAIERTPKSDQNRLIFKRGIIEAK